MNDDAFSNIEYESEADSMNLHIGTVHDIEFKIEKNITIIRTSMCNEQKREQVYCWVQAKLKP